MARVKQVGAQLAESSPKNIPNKKKRRGTFEQEEENEEEAEDDYELPSVQEWRTFKSYKTCQRTSHPLPTYSLSQRACMGKES
jgi:hypothetical protein